MKRADVFNKVMAVSIHTVALITTIIFFIVMYLNTNFRPESFKIFVFATVLFVASLGVYSKVKDNFEFWGKNGAPFIFFFTKYPFANLNLSIATSVLAIRLIDPATADMMGAVTANYLNFLDLSAYPQVYPLLAAIAVTILVLTTSHDGLRQKTDNTTKVTLGFIWSVSILVLLSTLFTIKSLPIIEAEVLAEVGVATNLAFQYLLQILWIKELMYRSSGLSPVIKKKKR